MHTVWERRPPGQHHEGYGLELTISRGPGQKWKESAHRADWPRRFTAHILISCETQQGTGVLLTTHQCMILITVKQMCTVHKCVMNTLHKCVMCYHSCDNTLHLWDTAVFVQTLFRVSGIFNCRELTFYCICKFVLRSWNAYLLRFNCLVVFFISLMSTIYYICVMFNIFPDIF